MDSFTNNSMVKVQGATQNLDLSASNRSNINTRNMIAESVKARTNNGSQVVIYANEKLDAQASNNSSIHYAGDPQLIQRTFNSGTITRKD